MTAWIGIASANHVARGRDGGFMQVCHGKRAPIARIKPGDTVIYYSPTTEMGGGQRLQSFTAAGIVREGSPYLFDMGGGFIPHRRDIDWLETRPIPIAPLLGILEFTRGKPNWGYIFRFGIVQISDGDADLIVSAMHSTQTTSERAVELSGMLF
jgi:hypothetical protein